MDGLEDAGVADQARERSSRVSDTCLPLTRFARLEEVLSPSFASVNKVLDGLNVKYELADHSKLNQARYPWSTGLLSVPAFYAARLWEYPFSVHATELQRGMNVADVGCGMTPFTIYLSQQTQCKVTGIDPDVFDAGVRYFAHGVSQKFITETGLNIVKGGFESLPLPSNSQDRVFCISVMEHVSADLRRRGMQEIARVLKPGGFAVLTVDMSMSIELNRPLDLIWDSGLNLVEPLDLRWPSRRFGMLDGSTGPLATADVLGMTLRKEDRRVETQYHHVNGPVPSVPAHLVPTLIRSVSVAPALWRRIDWKLRHQITRFRRG